jgi:hypothetical protein
MTQFANPALAAASQGTHDGFRVNLIIQRKVLGIVPDLAKRKL